MSRLTNFAVVGAGELENYIVEQLVKDKTARIVKEVVVLTRQVSIRTKISCTRHSDYSMAVDKRVPRARFQAVPR
jgi:S-adenosylmethionine synthetase